MATHHSCDWNEAAGILDRAEYMSMAMCGEDGSPYLVPVNFGHEPGVLYVHCAPEGRKLDILKKSPKVCLNVVLTRGLGFKGDGSLACRYAMDFDSVLMEGTAEILEDETSRKHAMDVLLDQYGLGGSGKNLKISSDVMQKTVMLRIRIHAASIKRNRVDAFSGKESV